MQADPVAGFLLAVALIITGCHLTGWVATRLRQPRVVGEIIGGLLLGPSILGALWPTGHRWIFTHDVHTSLHLAAELGIVCFVFLLGSELPLHQLRRHRRAVATITTGAVGLPLLTGLLLAWPAYHLLSDSHHPAIAHILFIGLSLSITALPVLARILQDLHLAHTTVGTLALASAAAGDALTWISLAALLAILGAGTSDPLTAVTTLVILTTVLLILIRPALTLLTRRFDRAEQPSPYLLPVLLAVALASAATTHMIGLHPVIGAFLAGLAVPRGSATVRHAEQLLRGATVTILLPLFFGSVGFTVALTTGGSAATWLLAGAILLIAVASKLAGAGVAGRLTGLNLPQSFQLGALMNCRGVTELAVLAVGLSHQLINPTGFTILTFIALATTAMTGPLLQLGNRIRRPAGAAGETDPPPVARRRRNQKRPARSAGRATPPRKQRTRN